MADDTRDDGGSAFPQLTRVGQAAVSEGGLSIRDYFAGQALVGFAANIRANEVDKGIADTLAAAAYAIADRMVQARK